MSRSHDIPARGLSLEDAAAYCGVSPHTLERHGPKPIRLGGRKVWDRVALDAWFDQRSGLDPRRPPESASPPQSSPPGADPAPSPIRGAIDARKNAIRHPAH